MRERLIGFTAYVEAFIDFPEEDIPQRTQAELAQEVMILTRDLAALSATFTQGKVYREGLRTAIVGKPNVGKSSLFNLLAGTERAIVTAVPGTTRDVLEETIVINGIPLVVWDTAGLRHTADEVERIGVERARAGVREAGLILALFDASYPLDAEDEIVCAEVAGKRVIPILNKVDLPIVVCPKDLEKRLPTDFLVSISARQGIGLEELGAKIREVALGADSVELRHEGALVSRARHHDALAKAERSLEQAKVSLQNDSPLDLVAVDLRTALDHIGEITGHVSSEDILDRVFREFCIGK
jgi:tRNA modification GTPase